MYADIVFMQGSEADDVLDKLYNVIDSVVLGATDVSVNQTFDYLCQWDYGDDFHATREDDPSGECDDVWKQGPYVLSANRNVGYVGLIREI